MYGSAYGNLSSIQVMGLLVMTNDDNVNKDVIVVRFNEEVISLAEASAESILLAGSTLRSTLEPKEGSRYVI